MMKLWGIDLGGTKIECAVLDPNRNLEVVVRMRLPTESANGYEHILSQIKKLIDQVAEQVGEKPTKIGFATPGVLEPDSQLMKNSNTICLNGMPLKADLEKILGIPVQLANDANCFALAEALIGAGKDYPKAEVVFGVIMGTGVGGGLVVNNKIIAGHHGIGGEWGHNILEENGEPCYCGKAGCVEQVISGPALERFYEKASGEKLTMKVILERYHEGEDEFAKATIERLLEFYGRAISTLINVIDPGLIVIGGGVGNVELLYTAGFEKIKKYIFNKGVVTTPILKPKLGDSAGVFGAALL
ncbi:ROK family protein [Dyadobacter chenwenxiniae]|uniref:ROK family protein n=2 Tax=Dyadobacter chenwenxiniae TaxID=2906456 RepID=A0A9X1PI20_9BACT|nr:ROK family protein [Dyadobacter chenwenxiniae]MCF0053552.1 ROK family protein [Dyadobacter chenwenxiniae]MCF0060284.1 ROK family protein [Dyadobacter chenwenxiniae]UON86366.1 ROK family protein [Dyadobacter chenwenxiniae]